MSGKDWSSRGTHIAPWSLLRHWSAGKRKSGSAWLEGCTVASGDLRLQSHSQVGAIHATYNAIAVSDV